MFYAAQFVPWDFKSSSIDATNKKESWLEAHGPLTSRLYKRKRAIKDQTHREDDLAMWQLAKVKLGPD